MRRTHACYTGAATFKNNRSPRTLAVARLTRPFFVVDESQALVGVITAHYVLRRLRPE